MSPVSGPIETWTVEDVRQALEHEFGSLPEGLGAKLSTNAVDGRFLMTLTDDDLMVELGCTKLQVKKVRRMIEEHGKASPSGAVHDSNTQTSHMGCGSPGTVQASDIPQPLAWQPPPPGGAYGVAPAGYPSAGMGVPTYGATPGYGGVASVPFTQPPAPGPGGIQQQPVPQNYGGQGVGMPPPMYYAPPNYNQMQGPYDQYAQQQQQGCACSMM